MTGKREGKLSRLIGWVDSRLGLSYPLLRPVPQYSINPFYWLGALAVVAFVIQGVSGLIMMLYYLPSPTQAYTSTLYIFQGVYYGRFLETVHLYTAYAMIMLAFLHMMRSYFVSVHKQPRELMWVVGMLMGFLTLGFGFTGYLLPWTVVSKSATDVGIGMLDALPPPLSSFLSFLIVGAGGDATVLLRFFDLHVVVLPAGLLVLLVVKMYMLESHGISTPASGAELSEKQRRTIPIFPDVSLYLLELAALFGSAMLLISVVFPLNLPPQYSPQLAAQYTPQPDWYFLWIYQILKISVFESAGLPVALSLVTLVFVALFLLPFLDRGPERKFSQRWRFLTIGIVFVGELLILTVWGLLTPGQVIPIEQAVLVLGGTALLITVTFRLVFRFIYQRAASRLTTTSVKNFKAAEVRSGVGFATIVGLGSLSIGNAINAVVEVFLNGPNSSIVVYLGL